MGRLRCRLGDLRRRLLRKGAGAGFEVQQVPDHPDQDAVAAESEIDPADFVPTTKFDVAEMWAELRGYVDSSKPRSAPARLRLPRRPRHGPAYRAAPAAKVLHHAWIGGLLEHVLTLVRVCRAAAPFYPEVDPDLLVTGAILHDIGKVRELSWGTSFSYTLEGQMIGHISIGQGMLREKMRPRRFPGKTARAGRAHDP